MRLRLPMLGLALSCACGDTGQSQLTVSLSAEGNTAAALRVGDADFTLSRADIAFGPVYFCATASADPDLCEVALLELRETVLLDGLAGRVDDIGTLHGVSGEIRSALFDYGISWLLTAADPRPAAAAPGGHSAVLVGDLTRAGQTLHFQANLDIAPRARGDAAINAQRTQHTLATTGDVLKLSVDPLRWLARVDVDALFALDTDGDGSVVLGTADQAYAAIAQGMQSSAPVKFVWERGKAP